MPTDTPALTGEAETQPHEYVARFIAHLSDPSISLQTIESGPTGGATNWGTKGKAAILECLSRERDTGVPEGHASLYVGHGKFAICDWADWPTVRGYWWRLTTSRGSTQYAQAHSSHDTKTRHRITMHGLIMQPPDGASVDHINGDGLDNRRANLRVVTHQQNTWNQRGHGGGSKFKGVSFRKDTAVWRAYLTVDGKRKWLGAFASEIDAARAYNTAARDTFGEFARLNDVD